MRFTTCPRSLSAPFWFPRAAALALGVLLGWIPSTAEARTMDEVGTGGNTSGNFQASCWGNKYVPTRDTTLQAISSELINTAGEPMTWYVYLASDVDTSFTRIQSATVTKMGTIGAAWGWETSPPMMVQMTAGRTYAVVNCWNATTAPYPQFGYNYTAAEAVSFGSTTGSAYMYSGTPAATTTWNDFSANMHFRTYTSAGYPLDSDPQTATYVGPITGTNFLRGNTYYVSSDRVLTGFDQRYGVTANTTVSWYIYRMSAASASACAASAAYTRVATGTVTATVDANNSQQWIEVDDIQVTLLANSCYAIGMRPDTANAGYLAWSTSVEPPVDAVAVDNVGLASLNSATLSSSLTFSYTGSSTVPQHLQLIEDQPNSTPVTGTYGTNADYLTGNIIQVTSNTRLVQFGYELDPPADGVLRFGVYSSTTASGPWTLVWENSSEVVSASAMGYVESGTVNIDLSIDPSVGYRYYMLGILPTMGVTNIGWGSGGTPQALPFGNHVSNMWYSTGSTTLPASIASASGFGNTWDLRVETCAGCANVDGDGYTAAADCNDMNAVVYPGAPEICDSYDNDCNGYLDEGFDIDGDGYTSCGGDCNDLHYYVSPGWPEWCDGIDNDCDGTTTPSGGEMDEDSDQYIGCSGYFANGQINAQGEAILGAEDCFESATYSYAGLVYPGVGSDTCDGYDTDCDGSWSIAEMDDDGDTYVECTSYVANSSAGFAGGGDCVDVAVVTNSYSDNIRPGLTEVCDSWDTNCSSAVNGGAPDQNNEIDNDADGYIDCAALAVGTVLRPLIAGAGDCVDVTTVAGSWADNINPGASESCDSWDTNCTVFANSGSPDVANENDDDGDGYIRCSPVTSGAVFRTGVTGVGDCRDVSPATDPYSDDIKPSASEACDGYDTDCSAAYNSPPTNETDSDRDRYIPCASFVASTTATNANGQTLLGGLDCRDVLVATDAYSDDIRPGATEVCDMYDTDCSSGNYLTEPTTETDNDNDRYLPCSSFVAATTATNANNQTLLGGLDCLDSASNTYAGSVNPGNSTDACDGYDSNCSSGVSAPDVAAEIDDDQDQYIECASFAVGSTAQNSAAETLLGGGDCVDATLVSNPYSDDIRPGAAEACDGYNTDCSGGLGNGTPPQANELNTDGDGYFACSPYVVGGNPSFGGGDCADTVNTRYPGAPELCNLIDDDCDGLTSDEGVDSDGDGTTTCTDCDDTDANVEPGAPEICDGKDSDCNGALGNGLLGTPDEDDTDIDHYLNCTVAANAHLPSSVLGGGDCADTQIYTYPTASEVCDGWNNDCNTLTAPASGSEADPDNDQYVTCSSFVSRAAVNGAGETILGGVDCLDIAVATNAYSDDVYPNAPTEACDGFDTNCSGGVPSNEVDEDVDRYLECSPFVVGSTATNSSAQTLLGGLDCLDVTVASNGYSDDVKPGATEACDGYDTDCTGGVPTNEVDDDADQYIECSSFATATTARNSSLELLLGGADCLDTAIATDSYSDDVYPNATVEACDGYDTNCAGGIPANEVDDDNDQYIECSSFVSATTKRNSQTELLLGGADCLDIAVATNAYSDDVYPNAALEACDGFDTNCVGGVPTNEVDDDGDRYVECSSFVVGTTATNAAAQVLLGGLDCLDTTLATNAYSDDVKPGAAEACDGFDTDCSSGSATTPPANEIDDDLDRYLECTSYVTATTATNTAGQSLFGGSDCLDTTLVSNAYSDDVKPGAAEACDGFDTDCSTGTATNAPANEIDDDVDRYLECGTFVAGSTATNSAAQTLLGGNDCLDTTLLSNNYSDDVKPGATEACDGYNTDCSPTGSSAPDQTNEQDTDLDRYIACSSYVAASTAMNTSSQLLLGGADCNAAVATVHPNATEGCNGVDDDCDSSVDEGYDVDGDSFRSTAACGSTLGGDCNDNAAAINPNATEACDSIDNDCDAATDEGFDQDSDGFLSDLSCPLGTDCDDGNPLVNTAAAELCNGIDDECDGLVDNGFDLDDDGYSNAAVPDCVVAFGDQADCDDSEPTIHPDAPEACDSIDQDCDLTADEDFDLDLDLHYATGDCTFGSDCDDDNPAIYNGAPELCEGWDNDCDGATDEPFDTDLDGYYDGLVPDCVLAWPLTDCADTVPSQYPGAPELCDDLDNNCDGLVPDDETDGDGDGYDECDGEDCDDTVAGTYPGAAEFCNSIDDDCSGTADELFDADGDGYFDGTVAFCVTTYGSQADCDDTTSTTYPDAPELCNALDDSCNGAADEGFDGDGDGAWNEAAPGCSAAYPDSLLDCDDGNPQVNPFQAGENCTNGIDDDCDGLIDVDIDGDGDGVTTCNGDCNDSDATIFPGATETCNLADDNCNGEFDGIFDVDDDGFMDGADPGCVASYPVVDCNDLNPAVNPAAVEVCDGADQDCDGATDEDFDLDEDGYYDATNLECQVAWPSLDCNDTAAEINPGAPEDCDTLDDDCDGVADEDFDDDGDGAYDDTDAGCVANYLAASDCDDSSALYAPGAVELCDGRDGDCDGVVPATEVDNDVDGYVECPAPESNHIGSPTGGGDCDDENDSVLPGGTELCNLVDEDCDGSIDEDFDADGDGYVDGDVAACALTYDLGTDCDDSNAAIRPGEIEVCNAVDDDCDGSADEDFDVDGDDWPSADPGFGCSPYYAALDCDDGNFYAFPGNLEDCTNGVDDNCAGGIDENTDLDADGVTTCNGDCNDDVATIYMGAPELCDLIDQDCDFTPDEDFDDDADGYIDGNDAGCAAAYAAELLDCDDGEPSIHPTAAEICDAVDQDCDGDADEDFDLDDDGAFDRFSPGCNSAYGTVNTDCDDTDTNMHPGAPEVCDAEDDDCDGIPDDGFDSDQDGVWEDDIGCSTTYGGPLDCDDTDDTVHPAFGSVPAAEELCDLVDNDCDGLNPYDGDGDGALDGSNAACNAVDPDDADCDDADAAVHPGASEVCEDEVDNDCDSDTDDLDSDCQGDDDDSSGDDDSTGDDDSVGDDDDATLSPPTLVEGGELPLPSMAGCASNQASSQGAALAFLGPALWVLWRRWGRKAAGIAVGLGVVLCLGGPAPAWAQGELEAQAQRQLDFGWEELTKKDWEKAISSADSALRLNPALYNAMVLKALAYEGKGELRRAESWLQTYLELTRSLSQAPEAVSLAERLKGSMAAPKSGGGGQIKATATVSVGKDYGAFGDGSVTGGALLGARSFSQQPCASGGGCEAAVESRPGFWAYSKAGFGGGLSVKAEYFVLGWVGPRVRFDLGAAQPVGLYEVVAGSGPDIRLDAGVNVRVPILSGLTKLRVIGDFGYGLRTWQLYENLNSTQATAYEMKSSHLGGGVGVRVEPGRLVGIDGRFSLAGLLGGGAGVNEWGVEVGVGIRPVKAILVRAAFDLRSTTWYATRTEGTEIREVKVSDLIAGATVGAGVVF